MGFATGTKFNLSDYPIKTQQGDYFFTRISHVACDSTALNPDNTTSTEGQLYSNTFSCLSMQINYRPLATSPKPKIYGTQTATVVGNGEPGQEISVDRYGRVRIQYHWHDISPGRVRVAQSWSGTNFG
jgi:type VI secretion system secreted protein VgrG